MSNHFFSEKNSGFSRQDIHRSNHRLHGVLESYGHLMFSPKTRFIKLISPICL